MSLKRTTHRDIAKVAGVTHVTVSLALRGHRSIPKITRDRIEAIAKDLGYRPDPALSALMLYRRSAKPSSYQGTLAWINSHHHPEELQKAFATYYLGARERCEELGYRLEEIRLADLGQRFDRLSKILRARNIQGLLFPPQEGGHRHITRASFDWENFSAIAFGFSLMRPRLNLVTNAQFSSTRLAVRKLRSLGYRRIGFLTEKFNERSDQNFLAGFLVERERVSPADDFPIHMIAKGSALQEEQRFREWFSRHKPQAILSTHWPALPWIRALKEVKSGRCGFAMMDIADDGTEYSGINQNGQFIGRTAVDSLIAMIHSNERGIPAVPRRILIEGRWMNGSTAPRLTKPFRS